MERFSLGWKRALHGPRDHVSSVPEFTLFERGICELLGSARHCPFFDNKLNFVRMSQPPAPRSPGIRGIRGIRCTELT